MSHKTAAIVLSLTLGALMFGLPEGGYAAEGDLTADQINEKVQAFYASVKDYKAAFVQTTAHKLFPGRLERAYGTLMYRQGGLMRWEYVRPDNKFFIYDGKTLWVYEPEVPQVFKGEADADKLRKALAFLTGDGKIKDDYTIKKVNAIRYGFPKGHVLKLSPKAGDSSFKHIELYIDGEDFRVVRSVVVDHEGNRNRLDFDKPVTNSNLDPKLFAFTPPAGVPVTGAP